MEQKRIFTTYGNLTAALRVLYHQTFDRSNLNSLVLVKHKATSFYAVLIKADEVTYLVKIMKAGKELLPVTETRIVNFDDSEMAA